jgi:hypothetical protein
VHTVNGNAYQGAVYVFVRGDDGWTERQELVAPDGGPFDQLASVALANGTALLGVPYHTSGGQPMRGEALSGPWDGVAFGALDALIAPDGAASDQLGAAVALSGTRALVLAPGREAPGMARGAAYTFEREDEGWLARGAPFTVARESAADSLGQSLALAGDTALIGAPFQTVEDESFAGVVRVLDRAPPLAPAPSETPSDRGGCDCESASAPGSEAPVFGSLCLLAALRARASRKTTNDRRGTRATSRTWPATRRT